MVVCRIDCMAEVKYVMAEEQAVRGDRMFVFNYDEDVFYDEFSSLDDAKAEMRNHPGVSFSVYVVEASAVFENEWEVRSQEFYDNDHVRHIYSYRMGHSRLRRFE